MNKKSEQWFDVGNEAALTISCDGDLIIRGATDASVVARGEDYTIVDGVITSKRDLKLLVPRKTSLTLAEVNGDVKIKGMQGTVSVQKLSGSLRAAAIDGGFSADQVDGDVKLANIGGALVLGKLSGDARIAHCGDVAVAAIHGDLVITHLAGGVTVGEITGDAVVRSVTGAVQLDKVFGDCALANLAGKVTVNARDDIRLVGPLSPGKHTLDSESTITLRWPESTSVQIIATAPVINNRLTFDSQTEGTGTLEGSIGDADPVVILTAKDRIAIKPQTDSSTDWTGYVDLEFDMAGIGERITAELNAKLNDLSEKVGPELDQKISDFSERMGPQISRQVEQAIRRAQAAVDRAVRQMQQNIEAAERRTSKARAAETKRASAGTAHAASAQKSKGTSDVQAEQLKILKMLEDGIISTEEANELLAALG